MVGVHEVLCVGVGVRLLMNSLCGAIAADIVLLECL